MKEYDTARKSGESLERYYKRLAKVADTRLLRIEQSASQPGMFKAQSYAYRTAMHDIQKWSGANAKRFNVKSPDSDKDIARKINDIRKFLGMITSTKEGVKDVNTRRVETINRKYGTNFTVAQFEKFMRSGQWDAWNETFASKTAWRTIGKIQANKERVKQAMKEADMKYLDAETKHTQRMIDKALASNKIAIEDLF
jgi:hypothetical protein